MNDPYGTADLRRQVLDAWAASPTRFREDANAEEDLALGGYRDRLVVELAQNAADAALRAGVPGALRLRLIRDELRAANTGAPLDQAGVQALAALRASAKRGAGGTVGRFGVGFSAVLSVSDEPVIASRGGGLRFSAARTRKAVAAIPALAAELDRRGGAVPVLRLPWPGPDDVPEGFDTEVRLPLRPGAAEAVRTALKAVDPTLLFALPGLTTVDLDGRVITRNDVGHDVVLTVDGASTRWRVHRRTGQIPAELLADRPTEERGRTNFAIIWAVPLADDHTGPGLDVAEGRIAPLPGPRVIFAPTPSDEPLSLPARLVADLPLGADRRHVVPGPLTDWLVERAADGYAELADGLADHPDVLTLVPHLGIAAAPLDARLCAAALGRLREASWLPPDAAVLEPGLEDAADLLRDLLPGLLPAGWDRRRYRRSLDALGVRRLGTADVVDTVSGVARPPSWWRQIYESLQTAPDADALGALPVPLADGRLVTGSRGLLLPDPELPTEPMAALGLRVVHPDAVHPLLERLGANAASARTVLADDSVRQLVETSFDEAAIEDTEVVADAVLCLVRAAGLRPGELPWLADLALEGDDGEFYPAGELLLPDSPLAELIEPDAPFGAVAPALVQRWGTDVLAAAGVVDSFLVLRVPDASRDERHDLDGEEEWYDDVAGDEPVLIDELAAVRDLEFVRADAWAQALRLLAAEPLRSVVAADAVLRAPGRPARTAPSYTRWWLARHPVLGGRRPQDLRLPSAVELDGLYDVAPPFADDGEEWLRLIGCRTGLVELLSDPAAARDLLERVGAPERRCEPAVLRGLYARLAEALGPAIEPPERVRVGPDRVVAAERATVLDAPYLLPLLDDREPVPGGSLVADFLDLPLASELIPGRVDSAPVRVVAWQDVPGAALAALRLGASLPAEPLALHRPLVVDGVEVPWWPGAADEATGAAALGRVLAWQLGRWSLRAAAVEAFARPADGRLLEIEDAC